MNADTAQELNDLKFQARKNLLRLNKSLSKLEIQLDYLYSQQSGGIELSEDINGIESRRAEIKAEIKSELLTLVVIRKVIKRSKSKIQTV